MKRFYFASVILMVFFAGCSLLSGVIEQSTGIDSNVISNVTDKVPVNTGNGTADSFLSGVID
ncbi:MAG: hypothetical protein ABIJ16_07665, partial [Bacteroidota bacterium]